MALKYLIIGSGAMGGISTAFLTKAGKDVTMIARGENYTAIKANGLHIKTPTEEYQLMVKVSTWEEYKETPDVVMLCVKAYNLNSIIPELDRVCGENTIVMPVMNALDIGSEIAKKMTVKCTILGGVAYIAVVRDSPGRIRQKLSFYNLVIGMRNGEPLRQELNQIKADFEETGAKFFITNNTVKAAMRKFFRVSTFSGVTCYFDTTIGNIRSKPEGLQLFKDMCGELKAISVAMGDPFTEADEEPFPGKPVDEEAFDAFMSVFPEYQSSMKYDWDNNRPTEIKEQILDVIELGKKYAVPMPAYEKVAAKMLQRN